MRPTENKKIKLVGPFKSHNQRSHQTKTTQKESTSNSRTGENNSHDCDDYEMDMDLHTQNVPITDNSSNLFILCLISLFTSYCIESKDSGLEVLRKKLVEQLIA
uniref:Uncharacterized protein n=1 Tax=Daphnia galeata TaxID=27404 RepID=A0A8J2RF53_9CRUS|nr:unnamed protein product [Daphnia galeata]